MIKKNQDYEVEILDMGVEGEGIAKIEGYTTFIKGALTGEKAKIKLVKAGKDYGFGKIIKINEKSKYREEPICPSFGRCGGCNLQHLNYEEGLKHKLNSVKATIKKQLGYEPSIDEIIGMGVPYNYRNKAQYPVSNGKIGFYADRSHELIENEICYIQNEKIDKLAKDFFKIAMEEKISCYDEATGKGDLRHIVTRIGVTSGEYMLVIVTNGEKIINLDKAIKRLLEIYPDITSIIQNINTKKDNVILGNKCITLCGKDYIVDYLNEYKFKISPLSFYQVNPMQTEVLYSIAKEAAGLTGVETVFDLYCGIGTISLFVSDKAKKVYGVEVVEPAIINARENAKENNVENVEFIVGEVEKVIPKLYEEGITADVVFVDPPRKGCDKTALDTIIKMKPEKLVYVSCNPATLARDLKILTDECFNLKQIKLVDMFPMTSHVETVAVLTKK